MKRVTLQLLFAVVLFVSDGRCGSIGLVTMDYPPYAFLENGVYKGFEIEIALEAFKRIGQPVTIKIYPWARVLHMMRKGYADGLIGAYKTPERETFMDYPQTPMDYGIVSLFVRKEADITFTGDLKALSRYRFCVVRGFSYGNIFDNAVKDGTIVHIRKAPTIEDNIKAFLVLGSESIMISEKISCLYQLTRLGKRELVRELPVTLGAIPNYIAFSKKRHRLTVVEQLDRGLKSMHADGTTDAIIRNYTKE
jgi:polar amino acid transport system substrate-binding protein